MTAKASSENDVSFWSVLEQDSEPLPFHCSLRESSRYKCQLNARTRSFKWSVSLCIGATVSAACMTIKHFLVELKDKFGRKTRKEEGDELWQRWRDGLSRKESKMMRPVGSQEVNGASVILLTSMLMKPMDQQSLVGWCVNVTQRTSIMVVVAKRRMTLQVICLHLKVYERNTPEKMLYMAFNAYCKDTAEGYFLWNTQNLSFKFKDFKSKAVI